MFRADFTTLDSKTQSHPLSRFTFEPIFGKDENIFGVLRTLAVRSVELDQISKTFEVRPPDALKIDVQGLTYEVLKSGENTLKDQTVCISTEVEFIQSYSGQKSFDTVHSLLNELKFEIFKVDNLNKWYLRNSFTSSRTGGQHTFCDLLYFRSIDTIGRDTFWTDKKAKTCLALLLLHNLTDAAGAYYERFLASKVFAPCKSIEHYLRSWDGPVLNFYKDPFKNLIDQDRKTVTLHEVGGKKIGLYGAGPYGIWIAQRLVEKNHPPLFFIDRNWSKLNGFRNHHVISPLDKQLIRGLDVIIICSIGSIEAIQTSLKNLGLKNETRIISPRKIG